MAIKVSSTTVIDDSRNLVNVVAITASANVAAGNINLADGTLSRPNIIDYALTHNALGSVSGAVTIDLTLGNYVSATTTGTTTWTFSNPPANPQAGGFVLELDSQGQTQNWPSVAWPEGTAPTLVGICVLVFITDNGGSKWRGALSMLDSR